MQPVAVTPEELIDLIDPAHAHAHTSTCWWDHLRPGWICPPAEA